MGIKLTHDEFMQRWTSKFRKVSLVEGQIYEGMHKKLKFVCSDKSHGVMSKYARDLLNDIGCQKCSAKELGLNNRNSKDKILNKLDQYGYSLIGELNYKNSKTRLTVQCSKGHKAFKGTYDFLTSGKTCCPECYRNSFLDNEYQVLDKIKSKFKMRPVDPNSYQGLSKPIDFICSNGHTSNVEPTRLLMQRTKFGCRKCFELHKRYTIDEVHKKTKLLRPDVEFLDIATYTTTTKVYEFKCLIHNEIFKSSLHNLWYNNHRCKICTDNSEGGYKSDNPGYLYYGKLGHFYKIGITNIDPMKRLKTCNQNFDLLDYIFSMDGKYIRKLELEILRKYKDKKLGYNPGVSSGWTEMFSCDIFGNNKILI